MKAIILRSLAVALLVGLCVSFATTAVWTRVSHRYDPGLTQAEMQKLSELPPAQIEAELAGRRKPYSRWAWLTDSLGLYVHALYTGGYPIHYGFKDGYSGFHRVEWRFMQWGSLTALAGIMCAVAGRGKGRIVLAGISIFDLLCWYFDARSL